MHPSIQQIFAKAHIDCYGVLPFAAVRVINDQKLPQTFQTKTVLFFLVPYYTGDFEGRNVSLYAVAKDYHLFLKQFFEKAIATLAQAHPGYHFVGHGDNSPLDERHGCAAAGLGMLGDNGLLISEKYGTYQFLAEILTDLPTEIADAEYLVHDIKTCAHCGACKLSCPMRKKPFGIGECLSAVTQTRRFSAAEEQNALAYMYAYHTAWGCDLCQTACPHNRRAEISPIPFFYMDRIPVLSAERLDAMDDEMFESRAYAWRGRACIARNLDYFQAQDKHGRKT